MPCSSLFFQISFEVSLKRLRIDSNDENEEEKQVKIQIEQIKNSCRHMYNYHNQLSNLENELIKVPYNSLNDGQKVFIREGCVCAGPRGITFKNYDYL
jgi:hypothetical protein